MVFFIQYTFVCRDHGGFCREHGALKFFITILNQIYSDIMANTWILFSCIGHLTYKTEDWSAKTQCWNIKGTLHSFVLIGYTCACEISSLHWFKYSQVYIRVFTNLLPSCVLWSMLMWRFLPYWCLPLSFGRWRTPAVQLQWYCSGVARMCFCL